ncbi:MAG: nanoRNase/pAp phosphatase (c-di-AMP/oligoRNAs hydrolase) [Planctomycetota bacterium]|jgi:nanoRNase/pAp phosphatase (c-di-AMP/oligoRNAs hydrolase)
MEDETKPAPAPFDGLVPIEHLRKVLKEHVRPDGGKVLLLTHRTPDPDALGALSGLAFLLRRAFGIDPEVATVGRIFRAENLTMVRELDLHFSDYEKLDASEYQGVLLVDTQPSFGHTALPSGLPILAVFDHHQAPENDDGVRALHHDVRLGVGSTATIVYEYLRDGGIAMDEPTATALACGIRFDTGDLSMSVTPLDEEAFFETFRQADRQMMARIAHPPLPSSYYRELHRSLTRARRHGPLAFGLLGRVSNPESVAEMADFFLRMEGARWAFVGGEYKGLYHVSLRTDLAFGMAYPLMSRILGGEGSFGGRGSVAGGQITLEIVDDQVLRRLERRLRTRMLALINNDELSDTDPRYGTRLTRLP